MLISSFNEDLLDLKEFSNQLESFIKVEHQYVDGGLVIGLSSNFGSGKSTFFRMWMDSMLDKEDEENPLLVLLNAWESDYYGDPLFAIISSLIERLVEGGKSPNKIIEAAKDLGWFSTAIGGQIVKKIIGVDAVAAGDLAEKKKKGREEKFKANLDSFSIYESRKKAMNSLREAITELVEGDEPRILFLVDELDRCRPDYAISYLETIKHIFDIRGTVFILAADKKHLENSARTAFGAKLDFDEYYRKFVHREVSLPEISESGYKKIAFAYLDYYIEGRGKRFCFADLTGSRSEEIVELISSLKLSPRQIQEIFRLLGHIFETTEEKKGKLFWCVGVGSILMAILKVASSELYDLLGTQQLEPKSALDFFRNQVDISHIDWWFMLCFTGGGLKTEENENLESILKRACFSEKELETSRNRDVSQWYSGWGHHSSKRFKQIFQKIEQLEQWSQ